MEEGEVAGQEWSHPHCLLQSDGTVAEVEGVGLEG